MADALRGYIRDDTVVLDRIYLVVARPVELDTSQLPAGAIVERPGGCVTGRGGVDALSFGLA